MSKCNDDTIVNIYKNNPNCYDEFANLLETKAFNSSPNCERPFCIDKPCPIIYYNDENLRNKR